LNKEVLKKAEAMFIDMEMDFWLDRTQENLGTLKG